MDSKLLEQLEEFARDRFRGIEDHILDLTLCCTEDGEDISWEIGEGVDRFREWIDSDFFCNGKTKVVVGFDQFPDYVFKIPIESERCYLYDEHEDRSIFDHEDSYFYAWEIFDYVSDDFTFFVADNCWDLPSDNCDYCSVEAAVYRYAEKMGVDSAFAGTWYLGDIGGVNIYVSERVKSYWEYDRRVPENEGVFDSIKNTPEMYNSNIEQLQLAYLIKDYSYAFALKLVNFINECNISDLHGDNYGCANNKLVILDYSGYRG